MDWQILFPGLSSFLLLEPHVLLLRLALICVGCFLVYMGYKDKLDPMLMIPLGFSMAVVNAGVLIMDDNSMANLFVSPLSSGPERLLQDLQIYFLQPVYNFAFANGLIACLIFMSIGANADLDYFIARPFLSLFLALCAELGTIVTLPVAGLLGFNFGESASIAMVGGADGPMVLFASIMMAKHLLVPITVVAYVYLSVCYAVYPYLIKLLVPRKLRAISMDMPDIQMVSKGQGFAFALIVGVILCILLPVAAPLFASFFLGSLVKQANIQRFRTFLDMLLSGTTLFLGFSLGALLTYSIVAEPSVIWILILGFFALIVSGIGGILGGLILCKISGGKINPIIGIAGVSCIPTTAKVAQKCAMEADETIMLLPHAMGVNVAGVITSAIICALYITFSKM